MTRLRRSHVRDLRARLDLSCKDFAALLSATPKAAYNWQHGGTFVTIRGLEGQILRALHRATRHATMARCGAVSRQALETLKAKGSLAALLGVYEGLRAR